MYSDLLNNDEQKSMAFIINFLYAEHHK